MNVRFLDLAVMHAPLRPDLDAAIKRVLDRGWFILGEEVEAFEHEWAAYVGSAHCVGVSNGLDALVLALRAVGVGPGDDVLVPSNTFIATWLAVSQLGARPVPVEPDVDTFLVSSEAFEANATPRTKAVVPVHLYGRPADVSAMVAAFRPRGIAVIEDAAQAHGAAWGKRRLGGEADVTCWSFYPGKNLGAFGDGGAITTDSTELAERIRLLANYGSPRKYEHLVQGVNARLDELQAAILRVKLRHLDEWNERRRVVAAAYLQQLPSAGLTLPVGGSELTQVWHLFVIRVPHRDHMAASMAESGVETAIHYPKPPHRQGAYASEPWPELPISEEMHRTVLSLPMGPHLEDRHVARVVEVVCDYVAARPSS